MVGRARREITRLALALVVVLLPWGFQAQALDGRFPAAAKTEFVVRFDALPSSLAKQSKLLRIDHEGRPTLLIGTTLFLLDKQKALPIPLPIGRPYTDLAWMDDGALIAIRDRLLGFPGPGGMAGLVNLPETGMRLSPGNANAVYLFGGKSRKQRLRAFHLKKGEGLKHLAEMPYPITALAGTGDDAFIAIGRSVLFVSPGREPNLVVRPRFEVNHLAYAPPHGLFYATHRAVGFVLSAGRGFTFLTAPDVQPAARGEELYLLIPNHGVLRVSPVSAFTSMAKELGR